MVLVAAANLFEVVRRERLGSGEKLGRREKLIGGVRGVGVVF